ncbi:MAG: hypothetical protein NBV63_00375 [Candidatus Pacebacteria bacterium]|nr:hypothetical protein [Candidatus Paceibacterota bacterium]
MSSRLTPYVCPEVDAYLREEEVLRSLIRTYGSPLNVVLPEVAFGNYQKFNALFESLGVRSTVYLAAKANKSKAIARRMAFSGSSIDVASLGELSDALIAGFSGERIEATGPKNDEFLKSCVLHKVLINVDDIHELDRIEALCSELIGPMHPVRVPIYIRLAIPRRITNRPDRFGVPPAEVAAAVARVRTSSYLLLKGFSFHFSTDKVSERVAMLNEALQTFIVYKKEQHPNFALTDIDIGGGYLINHLASKTEWDEFISTLKASVLQGDQTELTWNRSGLGFNVEGGKLRGSKSFSDYYQPKNQFETLREILLSPFDDTGSPLADVLRDLGVRICIEPGQSFFDQAGFTAAKIMHIKKTEHGQTLIVLDMNRTNINATDQEYMPDPLVLFSKTDGSRDAVGEGFLVGNLCLPADFISRRKFFFGQPVSVGDVLLFMNTAPYLMDFSESTTLKQRVARKIALVRRAEGVEWYEDENYIHL